eukprot:g8245.t1
MNSDRLERLLCLVENAPSASARTHAARQVARLPCPAAEILERLRQLLTHKDEAVREAAATAVGAVAGTIPQWWSRNCSGDGTGGGACNGADDELAGDSDGDGGEGEGRAEAGATATASAGARESHCELLTFSAEPAQRIARVLSRGVPLLASGGAEFDPPPHVEDLAAWLARQQRHLRKQLGLLDDPREHKKMPAFIERKDVMPAAPVVASVPCAEGSGAAKAALSIRQRYRAQRKRKARAEAAPPRRVPPPPPPAPVVARSSAGTLGAPPLPAGVAALRTFCAEQSFALFDPNWCVRHGAAAALRAALCARGACIAATPVTACAAPSRATLHAYVEDVTMRVVSVLALDRFADFGGGDGKETRAPVCEACALLLGELAPLMSRRLCSRVGAALLALVNAAGAVWHTRCSALLGVQALLSACTPRARGSGQAGVRRARAIALFEAVLPTLLPWCAAVLRDDKAADDVQAMAAACLLPVASAVATKVVAGSDGGRGIGSGEPVASVLASSTAAGRAWACHAAPLRDTLWLCLCRRFDMLCYHAKPVMELLELLSMGIVPSNRELPSAYERALRVSVGLGSAVHAVRAAASSLMLRLLANEDADTQASKTGGCDSGLESFALLRRVFWHTLAEHSQTVKARLRVWHR